MIYKKENRIKDLQYLENKIMGIYNQYDEKTRPKKIIGNIAGKVSNVLYWMCNNVCGNGLKGNINKRHPFYNGNFVIVMPDIYYYSYLYKEMYQNEITRLTKKGDKYKDFKWKSEYNDYELIMDNNYDEIVMLDRETYQNNQLNMFGVLEN